MNKKNDYIYIIIGIILLIVILILLVNCIVSMANLQICRYFGYDGADVELMGNKKFIQVVCQKTIYMPLDELLK